MAVTGHPPTLDGPADACWVRQVAERLGQSVVVVVVGDGPRAVWETHGALIDGAFAAGVC